MKKHSKHTAYQKPNLGNWGRFELAFVGTACGNIQSLVKTLTQHLSDTYSTVYIDSDHKAFDNPPDSEYGSSLVWKDQQTIQQLSLTQPQNDFDKKLRLLSYDVVFLNGNHHPGAKQVVFLDHAKTASLKKRIDQLTDVVAFIDIDGQKEVPDFVAQTMDTSAIPIFNIKDVDSINAHLKEVVSQAIPPLKALILAGGKSTRMGQDKALLNYHGARQLDRMVGLTTELGIDTFVSVSANDTYALDVPVIKDTFLGMGPLGAILSAFQQDPNSAWLVLAVDLPYLTTQSIADLIQQRQPSRLATAYLNHKSGFAEPLVAIYEPKAYSRMLQFVALGYSCPRKVLINSDTSLVEPQAPDELTNVNTPEDYQKALKQLTDGG